MIKKFYGYINSYGNIFKTFSEAQQDEINNDIEFIQEQIEKTRAFYSSKMLDTYGEQTSKDAVKEALHLLINNMDSLFIMKQEINEKLKQIELLKKKKGENRKSFFKRIFSWL